MGNDGSGLRQSVSPGHVCSVPAIVATLTEEKRKSGVHCVPSSEAEPSIVSRQPGGTGGGGDGEEEEEEEGIMQLDQGM